VGSKILIKLGGWPLKTREPLEFGLILSGFCKFWPSQIFS